jgi:SAM-dependent methyltransferase
MRGLREKWNARYRDTEISRTSAARVLKENLHLLPRQGKALDLACGAGANAIQLAQQGLHTTAWDLSDVIIAKLRDYALQLDLTVHAEVRDIEAWPPEPNRFDVIVVAYYLERRLAPMLVQALNPGGLLYYQTFIQDAVSGSGPGSPEFRLIPNELLTLFSALRLLVYREEGKVGDVNQGFRNDAMFIGLKA